MKVVNFPKCLHEIARQSGYARGLKDKYKNRPSKYDRGNKNEFVDTIGALGELIFLHFLIESNIDFKMVNMLDNYSTKEADFVINNIRIDVKCKYDNYKSFIINKESQEKGKGLIDFYAIVHVKSETMAEIHRFSYAEVDQWEDKKMKYSMAKYLSI